MLILLPPSEGKTRPGSGPTLTLTELSFPALTDHRETLLDAVAKAATAEDAPKRFQVSAQLLPQVHANAHLRTNPTAPVHQVYTGVLFQALDFAGLPLAAQERAVDRCLVFSALFGVLRLSDSIPAYRLSGAVTLPEIGKVASSWRGRIELDDDLIVDCRSGTYQTMCRPNAWPVRVQTPDGKVITHLAKQARGALARQLSEIVDVLPTPSDLVSAVNDHHSANYIAFDGRQFVVTVPNPS